MVPQRDVLDYLSDAPTDEVAPVSLDVGTPSTAMEDAESQVDDAPLDVEAFAEDIESGVADEAFDALEASSDSAVPERLLSMMP